MNILDGLNEQQKKAVTSEASHILVVAGAGSGKTKVLVSRLAWLMEEKRISPNNIIAVTFTNKAANEMKERVEKLTGINTRWMWIGTFHSLCCRLLRIESEAFGLPHNFIIYDDADSRSLIKRCLTETGLANNEKEYHPAAVLAHISKAKNMMVSPQQMYDSAADTWSKNIARIYALYQTMLQEAHAMDFDDLLTNTVMLLKKHPQVLAKYQERFGNILVDEYQDTNHCQYLFIKLLAGSTGNIFAVGDPDQSIYKWRGADIANILDFAKDYPDCQEIQLNQNYRSTQNILDAANSVIANNLDRKPKNLFTECGNGDKIVYYRASDDADEAFYVLKTVSELIDDGYDLKDCAVLFRTRGQSKLFEDACIRFNINYRVYGGTKFYERKEVKDTLAYLRLLIDPYDTESIRRIYNEPKRGIGKTTWDKLNEYSRSVNKPLWDCLADMQNTDIFARATSQKLVSLYNMFRYLQDFAAKSSSAADIVNEVWRVSGYSDMIAADPQKSDKTEILEQFYDTASDFDRYYAENYSDIPEEEQETVLSAFLGQISLATDMDTMDNDDNYLTLMTLHSAKGLEFPIVFLAGMEEGIFPHKRVIFSTDEDEMEEERRLCYVGVTRAKKRLYLTGAIRRQLWGRYESNKSSRFIDEMPQELLEKCGSFNEERLRKTPKITAPNHRTSLFGSSQPIPVNQPPAKKAELIQVGDKLRHATFGDGLVMSVSGSGDDMLLEISFPGKGLKKLIWKYAPLKKI